MYAPTAAIGGIIFVGGASDYQGGTVVDTTNSFGFDPAINAIWSDTHRYRGPQVRREHLPTLTGQVQNAGHGRWQSRAQPFERGEHLQLEH